MCAEPHRCSILLVEDEPELQDVLRVALEADGYDVAVVGNGRDALTHLRSTVSTCLIVLDLLLPVMNGRRFRSVQLQDRSLAWIPVVIVSGGIEAAREARELGAHAFVRKPVDVDELRAQIRRVGCCRANPRPDQRVGMRSFPPVAQMRYH
jgi:CheY-like chemotaxis protein